MTVIAKNPILPGFYPDPSICAVGDDFFLVNSSFSYFPGLPIMHSKDLAHWEQIGNVMTRASQLPLPLEHAGVSRGLFAPTIRYNKGTYYVICTNVCSPVGNFVVTTEDPYSEWSEPHYIEGADGIDPSLFFDDDGKCYYIGTHPNPEGCKYDGDWYIYIQEFDIKTFSLVGEKHDVWNGAMKGVHWPEGPHLYRVGDYYYLLHAEGGTGPDHAVCIARSKKVFGPYENDFVNPIFTHRHLGQRYPIQYVGHADMFKTSKGDWYMVLLAVRRLKGYTTLGRETFLARVVWENDWPLVNAGIGVLTHELIIDLPEYETEYAQNALPGVGKSYDFTNMSRIGSEFISVRNPDDDMIKLVPGRGLMLKCEKGPIAEKKKISFLALRQDNHSFEASVILNADNLYTGASAGLMLFQNEKYHLRIEISNGICYVVRASGETEQMLVAERFNATYVVLLLGVTGLSATVLMRAGGDIKPLIKNIDISSLSTEVAGGFVGCTVGMFAKDLNEDREQPEYACFKTFSYNQLVPEKREEQEKSN